jgi:5-methylcytosine-specific restriction endonuclease McrA
MLMQLTNLTDAQLMGSLMMVCGQGRAVLARLLAHLGEVEERRLHLEAACSSMFDFCVRKLGMSDGEACRRITAARLARRFPDLLVRIEHGQITLSTIDLVKHVLTCDSYDEIVDAVAHKTKHEVLAFLAQRAPKPDVPASITTVPTQVTLTPAPSPAVVATAEPQLAPLSATRHHVQFTASDELRQKLERAADLMRHANVSGDLAVVVERAVDLLIEKLEKTRLGKTSRPKPPSEDTEDISAATRRAVFARDGERCTFCDAAGNRCPARTLLELDHVLSHALGGTNDEDNLRVRCRAHNRLHAEKTFGKAHVEEKIRHRQQGYEPENVERAARGLVIMGFKKQRVQEALLTLHGRHADIAQVPAAQVIVEALAVLT